MTEYKPGDIANGHRLSETGEWVSVADDSAPPPPPPPPAVTPTMQPKKKKRVFLWVFLAVQLLFIVWILGGASGGATGTDCGTLDQESCDAATAIGTGIGVFFIVALWMIVDFLMAVTYGVYRLATRS